MSEILPKLNIDLLDKTLDHIKTLEAFKADGVETDEHWNQAVWAKQGPRCGTAMCFAGWACQLAGRRLMQDRPWNLDRETWVLVVEDDDGKSEAVAVVAQGVLGLNGDEKHLFDGDNDLDDLERIVADIKAGVYRS